MVEAVTNGIDEVAAEEVGRGAIALDKVIATHLVAFVIAVQIGPSLEQGRVAPKQAVDLGQLFDRDPAVVMGAGSADQVDDDPVHRVGGLCPLVDVARLGLTREAPIALDQVDDAVEAGARSGCVREEIVEPIGDIRQRSVAIAVLVEEMAVPDLETEVIDAVGDGVRQVLAKKGRRRAIVLNLVETGLQALLVVPVQARPVGETPGVRPQVSVQGDDILNGNPLIAGDAGR